VQHNPATKETLMGKPIDAWEEFTVYAYADHLECKIPMCGLCANSGIVNTTQNASWNGKDIGVVAYCICPNGRVKKKKLTKQSKWGGNSVIRTGKDV